MNIMDEVFANMKTRAQEIRQNVIHAFALHNYVVAETERGYFLKELPNCGEAYAQLLNLSKGCSLDEEFKTIAPHDYLVALLEKKGIGDFLFFAHDTFHNELELFMADKNKPLYEKLAQVMLWPDFKEIRRVCSSTGDGTYLEIIYERAEGSHEGRYCISFDKIEAMCGGKIYEIFGLDTDEPADF